MVPGVFIRVDDPHWCMICQGMKSVLPAKAMPMPRDVVATPEAMKMETVPHAPRDGKIGEILVARAADRRKGSLDAARMKRPKDGACGRSLDYRSCTFSPSRLGRDRLRWTMKTNFKRSWSSA